MAKKIPDKQKPGKPKLGRPSIYTPELAQNICETIATHPYSLKSLCDLFPHWPNSTTIIDWTNKFPIFSTQYLEAKRRQIHTKMEYASQLLAEADVDSKAAVSKAVAQVNLIKWEASHLLPKLYGEKVFEDVKPFNEEERAELRNLMAQYMTKHERDY